MSGNILGVVST